MDEKKEQFLNIVWQGGASPRFACDCVGINLRTYTRWLMEDSDFKRRVYGKYVELVASVREGLRANGLLKGDNE